jgi:hypothetical protein
VTANQDSAFYCSGDDTIYVGQRLASDVWRNFIYPARKADEPPLARKVGDFGLAFIVAQVPARALRVARTTASHIGDTAFRDPNHHATPRERRRAWNTGFRARTIAGCNRYLSNPLPTE